MRVHQKLLKRFDLVHAAFDRNPDQRPGAGVLDYQQSAATPVEDHWSEVCGAPRVMPLAGDGDDLLAGEERRGHRR